MLALISDIHGNLEALEAVLEDIDGRPSVTRVICLGDMVGYGPDPAACVERVFARCDVVLCGNHEHGMLHGSVGFGQSARDSLEFARRQLQPGWLAGLGRRRTWRRLQSLPTDHAEGLAYFCHASPRDPLNEYLLAIDCRRDRDKLIDVMRRIDGLCFVGHTHVPGVITERLEFQSPRDVAQIFLAGDGEKAIVNPGSVGQPRDGDKRASYALYDGRRRVQFVRVAYDVAKTVEKIGRIDALAPALADRLERGT